MMRAFQLSLGVVLLALARPAAAGYQLALFDDFDGPELNSTLWSAPNNYTRVTGSWALFMSEQCSLADSNLVLRTTYHPEGLVGPKGLHFNFSSCWVSSQGKPAGELAYGLWEWRAKLPSAYATRAWPALWLDQTDTRCWPVGGEIDAMERISGYRNESVFGTYHWGKNCSVDEWPTTHYNQQFPNASAGEAPIDFSSDYHVFTAEWNTSSIRWAVDGQWYEIVEAGNPPSLFIPAWPLYTIMNVAVAQWSYLPPANVSAYPSAMFVDWIRVWQDDGLPGSGTTLAALGYDP